MSNDNAVTIVGTATRDPEMRFTPNGANVATFGIARNARRKDTNGEWEDGDPQFYDVKCWGSLADNVAETITKGLRVIIFGELEYRAWETDSGDKRSKVEIKAEAVGPELRWASAKVTRNKKGQSGTQGQTQRPAVENPYL